MKNITVILQWTVDGLNLVSAPKGVTVLCRDYTVEEPPSDRVQTDADGFEYIENEVS